ARSAVWLRPTTAPEKGRGREGTQISPMRDREQPHRVAPAGAGAGAAGGGGGGAAGTPGAPGLAGGGGAPSGLNTNVARVSSARTVPGPRSMPSIRKSP